MALIIKDRVKQTTTSHSGANDFVMNAIPDGFQSFTSVLSDGDTTYYCAVFETHYEVGLGTWTESTSTLARTTILESSNSGNAVTAWGDGVRTVFITNPAEKNVLLDGSDDLIVSGTLKATGNLIQNDIDAGANNDFVIHADNHMNLKTSGGRVQCIDGSGNVYGVLGNAGTNRLALYAGDGSVWSGSIESQGRFIIGSDQEDKVVLCNDGTSNGLNSAIKFKRGNSGSSDVASISLDGSNFTISSNDSTVKQPILLSGGTYGNLAKFIPNEGVWLYYNNYLKFYTNTWGSVSRNQFQIDRVDNASTERVDFTYDSSDGLTINTKESQPIVFKTNTSTALTLDTSQNATFAGQVIATNKIQGATVSVDTNGGFYLIQASSKSSIRSESQPIVLQTYASSAWQDRVTVTNNGNVGINTSTIDANNFGAGHGILTVASDTGSAKTAMLNLVGDGNDTDATRVASLFYNDASAVGAGATLAGIEAYRASNHATDPGADLVFSTNSSGGAYSEKMRVGANGDVTFLSKIILNRASGYTANWDASISHTGTSDYGTLYITSDISTGDFVVSPNSTKRFRVKADGAILINEQSGNSGEVLTSNGSSSPPTWQTASGGGVSIGKTIAFAQLTV